MSDTSEPQETAAKRLQRAVNAAAAGAGSRHELEHAARALVNELRGRNEAPEQVLIQIKALLADAGLHSDRSAQPSLYRDIITWSIRCYYEDGKDTPSS